MGSIVSQLRIYYSQPWSGNNDKAYSSVHTTEKALSVSVAKIAKIVSSGRTYTL